MNSELFDFQWMRNKNQVKYRNFCREIKDTYNQTTLLKYATQILKRDPSDRFEEELLLLQKATEKMQFFQEINLKTKNVENRLHLQCCQKMTYRTFQQGETVFKQGDKGDVAYIVLCGSINIYTQLDNDVIQELAHRSRKKYDNSSGQHKRIHPITIINQARRDRLKAKMALPFHMLKKMRQLKKKHSTSNTDQELIYQTIHIMEEVKYEEEKDKQVLEQQSQIGLDLTHGIAPSRLIDLDYFFVDGVFKHKFLVELQEGHMFGELALIWNQPRSATIVAKSNLELGVLSATDYKSLLKDAELNKIEQKIKFFSEYFFKNCPRQVTLRYCYNFKKVNLVRGNHLYKQGDKVNQIYLIKKGTVDVIHFQYLDNHVSDQTQVQLVKSQSQLLLAMKQDSMTPINTIKFERVIYTLSKGEIVGDIEIMLKQPQLLLQNTNHNPNRQLSRYNFVVTSNVAKLYSLNVQHFNRILSDQPSLRKLFQQTAQQKLDLNQGLQEKLEIFYQNQYQRSIMNQQTYLLKQRNQDTEIKSTRTELVNEYEEDDQLQKQSLKGLFNKLEKKVNQKGCQKVLQQQKLGEHQFREEISLMEKQNIEFKKHQRKHIDLVPEKIKDQMKKQNQNNEEIRKQLGDVSSNQKILLDFKLFKQECNLKMIRTNKSTDRSLRFNNYNQEPYLSSKKIDTSSCRVNTELTTTLTAHPINQFNIETIERIQQQPIIIKSKHNLFRQKPKSRLLYPRYSSVNTPI